MAGFRVDYASVKDGAIVKLERGFGDKDWAELIELYKKKVVDGIKHWVLDLKEMHFISSNSIGMLIAFNTSVMANQGDLRILLPEESQVTTQVRFAKIDQILNCEYS